MIVIYGEIFIRRVDKWRLVNILYEMMIAETSVKASNVPINFPVSLSIAFFVKRCF